MPKYERKQMINRIQGNNPGRQYPMMNPYGGQPFGMPFNFHPNLAKHVSKGQGMYQGNQMNMGMNFNNRPNKYQNNNQQILSQQNVNLNNNVPIVKTDEPDTKYLASLEDDTAKRDYLGEFIFKKIENHPFAQAHNFTIDTIGKITGMILGIDDINEIVEIAKNDENLSQRINEALSLLGVGNN
jgi:hypothetical protein